MHRPLLLLNLICLTIQTFAQPAYVSHDLAGNRLVVFTESSAYSFVPYGEDMLRIGFHFGQDTTYPSSHSVVMQPEGSATATDMGNTIVYTTSAFEVTVTKDPLSWNVDHAGTVLLGGGTAEMVDAGSMMQFTTSPVASWFGGGSRAIPMDRSGRSLPMYNEPHYGYGWDDDQLNICIPAVVSSDGYGLYFENISPGNLSLGTDQPGLITYYASIGPLSCFLFKAEDVSALMAPFTRLTGRQPLPPHWAMGYIQSRFGYENEAQATRVVDEMESQGFPLDAIVFDLQWQGGVPLMGELAWDLQRFPDPEGMMVDFLDRGVKSVFITDPYFTQQSQFFPMLSGVGWLAKNQQGATYVLNDFWAGPAGLIDITKPAAVNWFWAQYRRLIDHGAAGLWTDLGEPEKAPWDMVFQAGSADEIHQAYNLLWSQFIFENFRADYPDRRLFNLTRSGYAGMQRFSTFPWSGDVQKSFGGMYAQVPIILGMGLSGSGFMGCDVGGFTGDVNPELYTRWQQMGAFLPVMRAHGGWMTEPYLYDEPYKSIVRKYIKLRYRMLPYNYTLAWENSLTGMPPARPLLFADPSLRKIDDEYLWGNDLLVAPVFEEGATTRSVTFPEGNWIALEGWAEYQGSMVTLVPAPLETMPVFVRGGAMIPALPEISHTEDYTGNRFDVLCFPDPAMEESSHASIYLDDGTTRRSETHAEFAVINLDADYTAGQYTVTMERSGNGYQGEEILKEMDFDIARVATMPEEAMFNQVSIPRTEDPLEFAGMDKGVLFIPGESRLLARVKWDSSLPGLLRLGALQIENDFGTKEFMPSGSRISFWPNPVSDDATLVMDVTHPGTYRLELYSIMGNLLASEELHFDSSGSSRIRWSSLGWGIRPPGAYIVRLTGRYGSTFMKVLKIGD